MEKGKYNILNFKLYYIIQGRKMGFTKDTQIAEILQKAPEKANILMEIGMHCIMCPASQIETIEEACAVHGIDVDEVLDELNK